MRVAVKLMGVTLAALLALALCCGCGDDCQNICCTALEAPSCCGSNPRSTHGEPGARLTLTEGCGCGHGPSGDRAHAHGPRLAGPTGCDLECGVPWEAPLDRRSRATPGRDLAPDPPPPRA